MARRHRKVKLTKAEQIAADIGKWQRAQERALIMERKAATLLKRSAVELARLHKRQARLEHEATRVETTPKPVALAVAVRTDGTEEIVPVAEPQPEPVTEPSRTEAWREHRAAVKRARKAKAPPGSERAALHHTPPQATAEARQAKMEALGFRRTGKAK